MGGLECRPEGNLPVLQKINHLAIRLGGETPDGVFDGGQVTIDLNSDAARRLEQYIGYNAGTASQATLLAQHWSEVRAFVSALQGTTGTTITQASLSVLTASPGVEGDTDDAARLRAGVLLESAAMLLRIFENAETCSPDILVDGTLPRFAADPTEIRSERNSLTTIASLYVRMGGEDDDGGLPDGTLAAPVTLTDVELREIDRLVGFRPPSEPASPDDEEAGSELIRNWQGVRAMIVALRNPNGVIDSTSIDAISGRPARERAAVQLQTVAGILRILHSEAWRAGRAYGTEAAPEVVLVESEPDAGPSDAPDAGPRVVAEVPIDAGPRTAPVSYETNSGSELPSWAGWLGAGLAASIVTGLAGIGVGWIMRGVRNSRPAGSAPAAVKTAARAVAAPPPPPPPPPPPAGGGASTATNNPPNPPSEPPADEGFLDDIDSALAEASSSQSPGVARPSGGSSAALVSPDNVIIEGPNAVPVNGVDADVIRAQVVLHYRAFLTQTAREALERGRPLPAGTELVNSRFEREVQEIVDSIMVSYHNHRDAGTLSDLWEVQRDREYFVRRGVPERLLMDAVDRYIEAHSSTASSPFSGGAGAAMRSEAAREVGEQRFLRDGMREVLRFSGR